MDDRPAQVEYDRFMAAEDPRVRKVELAISLLLRTGVLASLGVLVLGLVLSFVQHPEWAASKEQTKALVSASGQFPHTIGSVVTGAARGDGPSVAMAGLLLLIATPVMRVAVSILAFVYQKDRRFVIITSIVLIILISSFFLGRATE